MRLDPLYALLRLIYPTLCPACGINAPLPRHLFCLDCVDELPETGFHRHPDNPFTRHFDGRVPIRTGAAFLFFTRGGHTQRLLHRIKYAHQPEVALQLGRWYGRQLATSPHWTGIDAIVPVPLSRQRQHQRGYNQSERFARGIADIIGCPCLPEALRRVSFKRSLTGMGRIDRIRAIQSAFVLGDPAPLQGRHILLVDDVLTTGATLEACALHVWAAQPASLRLATIAMGEL